MSKIILDTEDFFQNDGYDDLMHIDHESYCCGEMFEKYETKMADLEAKLAESEEQLKEELEEKNGVERALSACNRQNDEFSDMIKKLVNEKEELKQQLEALTELRKLACEENNMNFLRYTEMVAKNEALQKQLHDLPKKIVCEISEAIERLSWRKRIYTNWEFDKEQLYKDLDTILEKFGGKDE